MAYRSRDVKAEAELMMQKLAYDLHPTNVTKNGDLGYFETCASYRSMHWRRETKILKKVEKKNG